MSVAETGNVKSVKPRKPRAKKPKKAPPTPAEIKEMLTKNKGELENIIRELDEEYNSKVKPLNLKRMNELVPTTLQNLREDLEDIKGDLEDLELGPIEEVHESSA